jgi:DnaJ-class molecular chaperone
VQARIRINVSVTDLNLFLCIAQLKTIYDQYGDDVLRRGVVDTSSGIRGGGYVYQKNCYEIFDAYFLKNNPFFDICEMGDGNSMEFEGSLFGSAFGGVNQPKLPPMPTIEVMVPTTLQEFYTGCMKTISYQRQTIGLDGKNVHYVVINRQVEVKPGMTMHNNYTFKGEGHQQPGHNPSNLYVNFQLMAADT